jgi:small subunit ribosomal protein S4
MVTHGHVTVNGKKVTAPSFLLEVGDKVSVTEKSKQTAPVLLGITGAKRRELPAWLEVNHERVEATVKAIPVRTDITTPVEERLVVEFYSR